jgi:hypothetical protein
MGPPGLEIREPRDGSERAVSAELIKSTWGSRVARRGEVLDPTDQSLIGASIGDEVVGVASFDIAGEEHEVVSIEAMLPRQLELIL